MQKEFLRKIKSYFLGKAIREKVLSPNILKKDTEDKISDLMKEAQKQITEGEIDKAKRACRHVYNLYYKLPIEKQTSILFQLKNIKDQIKDAEKIKEKQEIEELAKDLSKLKSESEVYIIFDKSDVHKKLNFLTKYAQKVEEQSLHGLKVGKIHLKEKLKELTKSAEKIEKEGERKFTSEEKSFLTKIKETGAFFIKKEEVLENAFKQKQKQLFNKLHILTKQTKIGLHPETNKKIVKSPPQMTKPPTKIIKPIPLPELKPHTLPPPKGHIEKKETQLLKNARELLTYLKKKREEGVYKLKPTGKDFLDKIEAFVNSIKDKKQKTAPLKHYEKNFLSSLKPFTIRKEENALQFTKEEKNMLDFLEHMREAEMVHIKEQKLQKEKKRLETKPIIEPPKAKINIERMKKLEKEEEKIMDKLRKLPKKHLPQTHGTQKNKQKRYDWEITADEIKKRKTKNMHNLLKEEKEILSKLNKL